MIEPNAYPILEFDDNPVSKIDPSRLDLPQFPCDRMVITFFPEVVEKLAAEWKIVLERVIPGENPVTIYRFADTGTLLTLGIVGCPSCAGNLDYFNAMGVKRVMFCGGGGVLQKDIEVGRLLLVDGAIRDEGFSYHYLAPSRIVYADGDTNAAVARYLEENSIAYFRGLTWTTDAMFRETEDRIARRRAEGARIVEMEQAGCLAVAQFRSFRYAALIYGGDDVSQEEWSQRKWRSRKGLRYDLVLLCERLTGVL